MTLGRYDMIAVIEARDDATYAKVMLVLGSKGGVRTETLRAFPKTNFATSLARPPNHLAGISPLTKRYTP